MFDLFKVYNLGTKVEGEKQKTMKKI